MRGGAILSLSLWAALSASAAASSSPPGSTNQKAFARCTESSRLGSAADVKWEPADSALRDHEIFRRSLGLTIPDGRPRILWYGNGGDLETTTISVIVVRNPAGIWHIDGVGQSQIWIKGAKPSRLPNIDRDLSAEDSRKLDTLIADPCLTGGPTFQRNPNIAAGGMINTLEVETADGHWIGGWWGAPTAQEQAVIDIIGAQ